MQPPTHWPKGVRSITIDELDKLGVNDDDSAKLYWDGRLVEIRRTVSLNWWQGGLATVTAMSAVVVAVVAVLDYIRGV